MKMKKLLGVLFALALFGGGTVQAAVISLLPSTQTVAPGTTGIAVDLFIDFTDGATIGGGLDISYDNSILSFTSFDWAPNVFTTDGGEVDPGFAGKPTETMPGFLHNLYFGNFFGVTGPAQIGTFTFDAIGVGTALIELAINSDAAGPFVDITGTNVINPVLENAEVVVTPLPAAAWLMLAGMGFLVGFGRRKLGATA